MYKYTLYCSFALRLHYVQNSPLVLEKLVGLLWNTNVQMYRNALALLFVLVQFLDQGFDLLDDTVRDIAVQNGEKPYKKVVLLLKSGDLDSQINALTLINVMLNHAPTSFKKRRLIDELEEAGLLTILNNETSIEDHTYLKQLHVLREITGLEINPGQLELMILRSKLKECYEDMAKQQRELHEYYRHEGLVKILKEELLRYRHIVCEAQEAGILIRADAPLGRYHPLGRDLGDQSFGRVVYK